MRVTKYDDSPAEAERRLIKSSQLIPLWTTLSAGCTLVHSSTLDAHQVFSSSPQQQWGSSSLERTLFTTWRQLLAVAFVISELYSFRVLISLCSLSWIQSTCLLNDSLQFLVDSPSKSQNSVLLSKRPSLWSKPDPTPFSWNLLRRPLGQTGHGEHPQVF